MSPDQSAAVKRRKAQTIYDKALAAYERWDVEDAVKGLEAVVALHPDNATYHMRLAQVLSRAGDFDRALRALANYLRLEPESKVASRIEQLFASGMDPVENVITERMTATHLPIDLIGAAIQMWMELRISLGRSHSLSPSPRRMGSRGGLYGAQGEPSTTWCWKSLPTPTRHRRRRSGSIMRPWSRGWTSCR